MKRVSGVFTSVAVVFALVFFSACGGSSPDDSDGNACLNQFSSAVQACGTTGSTHQQCIDDLWCYTNAETTMLVCLAAQGFSAGQEQCVVNCMQAYGGCYGLCMAGCIPGSDCPCHPCMENCYPPQIQCLDACV